MAEKSEFLAAGFAVPAGGVLDSVHAAPRKLRVVLFGPVPAQDGGGGAEEGWEHVR